MKIFLFKFKFFQLKALFSSLFRQGLFFVRQLYKMFLVYYIKENRSSNVVSNADAEGNVIATATEEIEYPDLLNENQSTSIGSNNNE